MSPPLDALPMPAGPLADADGPYSIVLGNPLTLDGSGSLDPNGDPLSYTWDLNDDGTFGDAVGSTPTLSWSDLTGWGITGEGDYPIALRVDDGTGREHDDTTTLSVTASEVVDRHVFYHNSAFEAPEEKTIIAGTQRVAVEVGETWGYRDALRPGYFPSQASDVSLSQASDVLFARALELSSFSDNDAAAPDKMALLPGTGPATSVNYTSFSRGLNGIMVDLSEVPDWYTPTAGDFEFKVGNSDDPDTWTAAPAPAAQTFPVAEDAGTGDSDRITIIWEDHAIRNQWLQVTVLGGTYLGLAEPHVFYFGNAVGEACNSTADAQVTTTDLLLARNNPRNFTHPTAFGSTSWSGWAGKKSPPTRRTRPKTSWTCCWPRTDRRHPASRGPEELRGSPLVNATRPSVGSRASAG